MAVLPAPTTSPGTRLDRAGRPRRRIQTCSATTTTGATIAVSLMVAAQSPATSDAARSAAD